MNISEYLNNHTIVKIGQALSDDVCAEVIVDDPIQLIAVVRENNCYIHSIGWWDRVELLTGSPIGFGGPLDPRCPNEYFFSETHLSKKFDFRLQDKEYIRYFNQIKCEYNLYSLVPSFKIKRYSQKDNVEGES